MFAPIDPRGGSPQIPAYVDGFGRGPTYSFLFPGAGQLARGNPQHQPGQWDPHGQLLQLLTNLSGPDQPAQQVHPIHEGGGLPGGLHRGVGYLPPHYEPGSIDVQRGAGQQLPLYQGHHEMVGAAQNLARFLAQQHTAGLRRYNGRH